MELREHEGRLACDACGGIMMTVADFEAAVIDFGAQATTVVDKPAHDAATEAATAAKTCPRCEMPMVLSSLVVDKRTLSGDVFHCAHHGVWFGPGALETAFIELGRRTEVGRMPAPSVGWWKYPITERTDRRHLVFRPRERVAWKSSLDDRELRCPTCRVLLVLAGMRWPCTDHGAFVEHTAFAEMVEEMTGQPWEPVWTSELRLPSDETTGGCPVCGTPMSVETIRGVRAERCAEHGLWFADDHLVVTLAKLARPEGRGWLSRLFR